MWEQAKRAVFQYMTHTENVVAKVMRVMRMVARIKYIVVTNLIGSIYLSGSPSSVLHVVLLHLGTNLWAGSDVACRLEEKTENEGGRRSGEVEERRGEGVFLYQNLVKQQ